MYDAVIDADQAVIWAAIEYATHHEIEQCDLGQALILAIDTHINEYDRLDKVEAEHELKVVQGAPE